MVTSGLPRNPSDSDRVRGRILDFVDVHAPWHLRLWDSGLVLGLGELSSSLRWVEDKVLSPGTISWLARDLERQQGPDKGAGGRDLKRQLQVALSGKLRHGNSFHRTLDELVAMVDANYLTNWGEAVKKSPPSVERFARALCSHLLDAGLSALSVTDWAISTDGMDLSEMAMSANELLLHNPVQDFEILMPFVALKDIDCNRSSAAAWASSKEVSGWMKENYFSPEGGISGGFRYVVRARDAEGAAEEGRDILDRLRARSTFSRRDVRFKPAGHLLVKGVDRKLQIARPKRGVFALSLVSERRLFSADGGTALDNALELAAVMNDGPTAAAVAGGWSAIESLLLRGDDESDSGRGVIAADRMASLITCSWPRAELTRLAHRHSANSADRLSHQLKLLEVSGSNLQRAACVERWIRDGNKLNLTTLSTIVSEDRMRKMVNKPHAVLNGVKASIVPAMRRLYRHRNLTMHGGAVNIDTLRMTLRTVSPLVGAGLDRIAHATIRSNVTPVQLASKADLRLTLVGGDSGTSLVDLLE